MALHGLHLRIWELVSNDKKATLSDYFFTFFSLPSDFSANLMVALRTDPQQVTTNAAFRLLALT